MTDCSVAAADLARLRERIRNALSGVLNAHNGSMFYEAQDRFLDYVLSLLAVPPARPEPFTCKVDAAGATDAPSLDCDWPYCGCDPYTNKLLAALARPARPEPPAEQTLDGPFSVQHHLDEVRRLVTSFIVHIASVNDELNMVLAAHTREVQALQQENAKLRADLRRVLD